MGQEGHGDYRKQLPCRGKYKSSRKKIESIVENCMEAIQGAERPPLRGQ